LAARYLRKSVSSKKVAVRHVAIVLVALLTTGEPAASVEIDHAVLSMLQESWLGTPSPSGVVICHGGIAVFGLRRARRGILYYSTH
jgi:hypothetical protein